MLAVGSFFIYSCDNNDNIIVQNQVETNKMLDITGTLSNSNNFAINQGITIQKNDIVLVYRRVGNAWQMIPKNYYLDDVANYPSGRELEYNFVFDTSKVQIRTESNFNQATEITPSEATNYLINQTFRVVLVPAEKGQVNKTSGNVSKTLDYSDYNAVSKYYNLSESQVKTVTIK